MLTALSWGAAALCKYEQIVAPYLVCLPLFPSLLLDVLLKGPLLLGQLLLCLQGADTA